MEGERILKSLLNGEIDGLYEDTKNYLAPLQFPVKNKNGVKGNKTSEETISKYTRFCTTFLRYAVETLKKVKAKAGNLDEITASLKLVGSLLNNTVAVQDGYYFRFISSLDQLAKTIYLIIVQLIGKSQYVSALGHASDLLKFIQLVNSCKSHDSEKAVKELTSLALRASDTLLQGAGKLEEVKVTAAQRPSHLCVVLEWRKLSLQFQAEAIMHSSLKSLVERTLKCGTKYQLDCGQNNVNFKCLASFFESLFNVVLSKTEKVISGGKDSLLLLAELGFHYGRICSKAGMATQALTVFDKMLEICESTGHGINGHTKTHLPSQVCCCVCFICKATISLNCTNSKSQSKNYNEQLLVECNRLLYQVLKCKMSSLPTLKVLSDALEYFRISLQSAYNKGTGVNQNNVPILLWKTFWETTQLLQSYVTVLSLQCERLKHDICKINSDSCTQLKQQIHKITDRQVGVLSFIISSFQDQLKSDKLTQNDSNSDARYHIEKCIPVVQKASALIHSVLEDPEIPLSYNELRWLGCNVYNLGCLCYQRDWFVEGAPLLTIACDELRVWCFAAGTEEEVLKRNEEVKLLTKFSLLADCQRRAKKLNDALRTATTQVLISVKTGSDVSIVRQQVKQWTTLKHEVLKSLQDEAKQVERPRTLCTALAEQEDTEDIDGGQLCLVLQEELACYKAKSYDTAVEQIAVIKQLLELYIVQEDEFAYGSSMIELAIALHRHGDSAQNNDKSALECCREGTALLEQLSDKMAETNHDEECYSSVAQDRLAAAYLWQAMLEHKAAMEERQTEEKLELTESFDANELDVVGLEEEFVSSLHSALETWVRLVERSMKKGTDGKIELQHFSNPEESFHYLLTTAGMLGLVNQPVKKTCALHMASILSKAIGSTSILETGVCALSEAVHTMCEVLNIHHASFLLRNASEMLDNFESSDITKVQFLLAKSHFLLLSGKFSVGENCLKEVLQSGALTHKSYKSHLIKARLKSLCAKYSVLPGKHHMLTVTSDPGLGSVTPLESALDGFYKLSRVVEEVFGEDTFSVSKKKENQKQNGQGEGSLIPSSHTQSLFHLSLLDDLLSSLLHVGQLYFHQGAVREAFRQFIDGLSLAWHFCLSHRISDFLVNIAQLELKQGKKEKCQKRLEQLKGILQPVLRASIDAELAEESIEEPEFIGHPESCKCVNCSDTALHTIIIKYCTCLSGYLVSLSRPEQSKHALDVAETVCLSAQTKMTRCLDKLDVSLHLCGKGGAQSSENRLNGMQKKGKAKSAKGKKQKDPELVKNHLVGVMFSQHQLMLQCLKAEQFLLNGKVEEANSELSKAIETLASAEGVFGYIPVCLLHLKVYFLYLSGVTVLLLNKGNVRDIFADFHCFAKNPVKVKNTSSEDTELKEDCPVAAPVEDEIEKPRRGLSRRGKSSKPLDEAYYENNTRPTSSRTKSRGRRKKVQETDMECDDSDEVIQQKSKGCRSVSGHVKSSRKMSVDKIAPAWLDQVIEHWKEAFDLCTACPPASQFSDICKGLAFCLGRAAAGCAMYYLNLSMSVTLRHQALTSTGKRIKRITKDLAGAFPSTRENGGEITHLVKEFSSLSLNTSSSTAISPEVPSKLDELVKIRNVMKFNSLSNNSVESSSHRFTVEEMALLQKIPKEWTVCTLETVELPGIEQRELLICRIRAGSEPVLVKINTTAGEDQLMENDSDDVVMDLTRLFQCNLMEEFSNLMSDNVRSMSVESTSEWWAKRTRLDTKMKNFLEKLEAAWLGRWKGVVLGEPVDKDCQDTVIDFAKKMQKQIGCLCGCEPDMQLLEILVSSLPHLSRQEMCEAFAEITGMDPASPCMNQLLDEFGDLSISAISSVKEGNDVKRFRSKLEKVPRHPVILILGKDIQHLPWESIPILYDHPVSRIPSLHFLLSKISCETQFTQVDPEKSFYALNPQNNLPNTQKMFQKWFESENGWLGITGQAPTQEEFRKALTDYDLFIYFGHGTGREFLQGDDIQRLDCHAVTLLMGCSSGKLMVGGKCEPRGMVLNYLLAGCPAIVANLWDVTDKDIDRFSELLLKQWLDPDAQLSLPEVLSQSRQACKLKYLIGASPVLYGLPLYIKQ